ncbi:MAG: hypothetical protein K2L99_03945 [Muribaculaceae bacterium]|nr:hypothetical protein [Muribaculaceae bacterium]
MIKKIVRSMVLPMVVLVATGITYARMTDAQVVQYAKTASAQGKSKEQIGRELMAQGVSKDQLQRIQSQMANAEAASRGAAETNANQSQETLVRDTKEQDF